MSDKYPTSSYGVTLMAPSDRPIVTPLEKVGEGGQGKVHVGTIYDPWALIAQRARWGEPELARYFGLELPPVDRTDTRAFLNDVNAQQGLEQVALEHWKNYQNNKIANKEQADKDYNHALNIIDPTLTPGQKVAIKRVKVDSSGTQLAHVVREAHLLQRLNAKEHPNLPRCYGMIHDPTQGYCILLEYLEGTTVMDYIHFTEPNTNEVKRKPLSLEKAVDITIAIGEALQHCHAQGVLHRDIKPGNIMILPGEKYVLFDFGLSKAPEQGPGLTTDGIVKGTPNYMAPEQLRGEQETALTDVFLLAQTFFHMATGHLPIPGELAAIQARVLGERDPYTRLTDYENSKEVSEALEYAMETARAREPAKRLTLDEFVDELKHIRDTKSYRGRDVPNTKSRWTGRKKMLARMSEHADSELHIYQRRESVDQLETLVRKGEPSKALETAKSLATEFALMPATYDAIKYDVGRFLVVMARLHEKHKEPLEMGAVLETAKIYVNMIADKKLNKLFDSINKRFEEKHKGNIDMLKTVTERLPVYEKAIVELKAAPDKAKAQEFIAQIKKSRGVLGLLRADIKKDILERAAAELENDLKEFEVLAS